MAMAVKMKITELNFTATDFQISCAFFLPLEALIWALYFKNISFLQFSLKIFLHFRSNRTNIERKKQYADRNAKRVAILSRHIQSKFEEKETPFRNTRPQGSHHRHLHSFSIPNLFHPPHQIPHSSTLPSA